MACPASVAKSNGDDHPLKTGNLSDFSEKSLSRFCRLDGPETPEVD
jgi:hypothetical protein